MYEIEEQANSIMSGFPKDTFAIDPKDVLQEKVYRLDRYVAVNDKIEVACTTYDVYRWLECHEELCMHENISLDKLRTLKPIEKSKFEEIIEKNIKRVLTTYRSRINTFFTDDYEGI